MGPRVACDPTAQQTPTSTRWVWAGGSPANGGNGAGSSRWNAADGARHWLADEEEVAPGLSNDAHSVSQLARGDRDEDEDEDEVGSSWRRAVDKARRWLTGQEDASPGSNARSASWLDDPAAEGLDLLQLDDSRAKGKAGDKDDGLSSAHHAPQLAKEDNPQQPAHRAGWLAGGADEAGDDEDMDVDEDGRSAAAAAHTAPLWTAAEDRAISAIENADKACIVSFDGALSAPGGPGSGPKVTGAGVAVFETGARMGDGWATGVLQAQVASALPFASPDTNNVAEGGACLHALLLIQEASERRLKSGRELTVDLRGDSELVVAWASGRGTCDTEHLVPYFRAVRKAVKRCGELGTLVAARHVLRHLNKEADEASRIGQTAACSLRLQAAFEAGRPRIAEVKRYLTANQLLQPCGLHRREVGGEGDCQFASVAFALHGRTTSDLTQRMRQLACEELLRNAHRYVQLVAPDADAVSDAAMAGSTDAEAGEVLAGFPTTYRRFVAAMSMPGVWGDGVTLAALSRVLGRVIVVLRHGDDTTLGCNIIHGGWEHEETQEAQQARIKQAREAPLALWYTGSHYQAVVGKREAIENAASKALFETQKPPVAIMPEAAPAGEKLNRRLQALTTATVRKETEVQTALVTEQWQVVIATYADACASQAAAVVLCRDEHEAVSLRSANMHATAVLESKPRTVTATRTEGTLFYRARGAAQATSQGVAWQVGPDVFRREPKTAPAPTRIVLYASIRTDRKKADSAAQLLRQAVWSVGGTAMGRGTVRSSVMEMPWGVPPSSVKDVLNRSGTLEGKTRFPIVRSTHEEAHKWRMRTTWLEKGTTWAEADAVKKADDFAGFAMREKEIGVRRWVDLNNPGPQSYRVSGVGGLSNDEVVSRLQANLGWEAEVSKRTSGAAVVTAAAVPKHTRLMVEKEERKQWVTVQPLDENGGPSIRGPQSWASRVRSSLKKKPPQKQPQKQPPQQQDVAGLKKAKKERKADDPAPAPTPSPTESPPAWAAALMQQMQTMQTAVASVSSRLRRIEEEEEEDSESSGPSLPPPEDSEDEEEQVPRESEAMRELRAENAELKNMLAEMKRTMTAFMQSQSAPSQRTSGSLARSPSPFAPLRSEPPAGRAVSFAPEQQQPQRRKSEKRGASRKASEANYDDDEREKRQKLRDSLSPKKTQ